MKVHRWEDIRKKGRMTTKQKILLACATPSLACAAIAIGAGIVLGLGTLMVLEALSRKPLEIK